MAKPRWTSCRIQSLVAVSVIALATGVCGDGCQRSGRENVEPASRSKMENARIRFFQAARTGDVGEVKACLSCGVDVNLKDSVGLTALLVAVANERCKEREKRTGFRAPAESVSATSLR